MCYVRMTEGKIEKIEKRRQIEDRHLNFYLHNTLCLPESVHKISLYQIKQFAEKTLTKNVHMSYIGVTEGKIEKDGFSIFIFIYTNTLSLPEGVHKI